MTVLAACLALAIALLPQTSLEVKDAWLRQTSATRTVSSGYLRLENRGATPVTLVRVAVDGAQAAELHTLLEDNGRTLMKPLPRLVVPARSSVTLEPGGTHLMVTGVTRPFRIGDLIRLTLTFDRGQTRTVKAVVRPLDAMAIR